MKTLISSINPPLYIKSQSPLNPKTPTLKHWKIHSSTKGFQTKSPKSTKSAKIIQTDNNFNSKKADNDDKIPDAVFERMIARILLYTGAPMGIGLVLLQVFSILKESNLLNLPNWVPFLTTFVTFGSSSLGIAYGTLSTSWDPEDKGSVLGFDEAKRNWVEMWKEDS